jgi:pyroglutamyl-peptidase
VTGFTAFDGDEINPSGLCAAALDGQIIAGRRVIGQALPVAAERAMGRLQRRLDTEEALPVAILAMGVSGRRVFSVETTAHNFADYRLPDDDGWMGTRRLHASAPEQLECGFHGREIAQALEHAGLPVEVSTDPGRFVCNHFYFEALRLGLPILFLHGPRIEGMHHFASNGGCTQDDWLLAARIVLMALSTTQSLHVS